VGGPPSARLRLNGPRACGRERVGATA
jgi:hypothetical protein